jgi:pimeloyl-ACP methyl ester carboxylesterase
MKILQLVFVLPLFLFFNQCYTQELATLTDQKDTVFKTIDGITIRAETGTLLVPENRLAKRSRKIQVKYVWLKSLAALPKEPLLFLAGGPGNTSTWQADDPEQLADWLPYLNVCDVILYDQRGTNDENLVWYWDGPYPRDFLVNEKEAGDHYRLMAKRALEAFKKREVDILGYTTIENAHDIDDLRKTLHIDKLSVLGFSYGTHLGLTLIKLYGQHISNAVLAGVEGLDHTFDFPLLLDVQFKKIAKMVQHDKQLHKEIPDLVALLDKVMKKLDQQPVVVTISDPLTGKPLNVRVGSFGLALILRLDMGDATDLPVLPRLIYSIDKGDLSILKWFVQKRVILAYGIPGMSIMMDMASGVSDNKRKEIEAQAKKSIFRNVANFPFYDLQSIWPAIQPYFDITIPVVSDVRTLLISGEYDYNTPPAQAEEVKWGFSNATHLVVSNSGHEQILTNDIIRNAIADFLSDKCVKDTHASHNRLQFIPAIGKDTIVSHPSVE